MIVAVPQKLSTSSTMAPFSRFCPSSPEQSFSSLWKKDVLLKCLFKKKKILQGELHEALRILGAELFVLHD